MSLDLDGRAAFQRIVKRLTETEIKRAADSANLQGLKVIRDTAKNRLPRGYKRLRRGIRYTRTNRSGRKLKRVPKHGQLYYKVGVGVGVKPSAKVGVQKNRGKKKGVGISAKNAHWPMLGTENRWTKRGRFTGRMPVQKNFAGFMAATLRASRGGYRKAVRREFFNKIRAILVRKRRR